MTFDINSLFTGAQSDLNAMTFDLGSAFTALIAILIIIQALELLVDLFLSRINKKSESDDYAEWKSNKERLARWQATYDAENSVHGPAAPERKVRTGYL